MRKRGSLNLSINAIVVLILAITMLGLGLAFMRNIFGGATEEFQKTSGEIEKQMIEQMEETNKVVSLSRPKVEIEIGERDQIFIGLKNDQQDGTEFLISNIKCTPLGSGGTLSCGPKSGDLTIEWMEDPIPIAGGEVVVLPMNLKVLTTASEGTCFCTITVDDGIGGTETTELTVDVTV
jgi:hypothetical protein